MFILSNEALFSIWLSVKVSVIATMIVVFLGMPLAYTLAKKNVPFRNLIESLTVLPLVFPPTVTGYLLLLLLGLHSPLGRLLLCFDISFVFTPYGAILAAAIASFPIFVKGATAAIASVDNRLIDVSFTLGKGEFETFWKVVFPIAKREIAAATVLSFARALGEFGGTLMLAGNIPFKTNTVPLQIYNDASSGNFGEANLLTLIMAIFSLITIYLIDELSKSRRLEW